MELTKQALKVDNNQSFPNNNSGLITPTALRTFNENMIDSNVNQAVYTADSASFDSRINAITGSGGTTNTGSLLTTASFDNNTRNLTFTKGDSSTFAVNIPDASGSVLPPGVVSGSSQVSYPLLSNIPAGIVSGSSQLTGSFVTTNTTQVITGAKSFFPPGEGVGISLTNATKLQIGTVATNRLFSPDLNNVNLEAVASNGTNSVNLISGVSGSVIGGSNTISILTRGNQPGNEVLISSTAVKVVGNTGISGSLNVSSSLSHGLQQGFVLVGDSSGRTTAVSTGSFGGGGTGNGFPFSGSAVITGSLSVSETVKSQVYMNPQTLDGFTIPTNNNAMLVGPIAISGSVVVEGNSNLIVLSQVTSSSTPLPSGVVSGSSQLTASYDLRYALSGSGTINTGSFATTGSNLFIGNQTITGSLFLSSSVSCSIIVPNGFNDEGLIISGNLRISNGDLKINQAIYTGGIYTDTLARNNNNPINVDNGLNIRPNAPGVSATNVSISGSLILSQSLFTNTITAKDTGSFLITSSLAKVIITAPNDSNFSPGNQGGVVVTNTFSVMGDTRLEGAVRFQQCDVNKIVKGQGGSIPQLAIVSDTLIYDDSGTNPGRTLGVSGSVFVSQSINIGEAVRLSPLDPLPSGTIGALAVSGSSLYFYNGAWTLVV